MCGRERTRRYWCRAKRRQRWWRERSSSISVLMILKLELRCSRKPLISTSVNSKKSLKEKRTLSRLNMPKNSKMSNEKFKRRSKNWSLVRVLVIWKSVSWIWKSRCNKCKWSNSQISLSPLETLRKDMLRRWDKISDSQSLKSSPIWPIKSEMLAFPKLDLSLPRSLD